MTLLTQDKSREENFSPNTVLGNERFRCLQNLQLFHKVVQPMPLSRTLSSLYKEILHLLAITARSLPPAPVTSNSSVSIDLPILHFSYKLNVQFMWSF